jgi:Ca2+/Na+ antiporter
MNIIEKLEENKNLLHIFLIGPIIILFGINKNNVSIINDYENLIKVILVIILITLLVIFKLPEPKKTYYFIIQIVHYIIASFIVYILLTNNIKLLFNDYMLIIGVIVIIYHIYLYYTKNKNIENKNKQIIGGEISKKKLLCMLLEDVIQNKDYVYHSGDVWDISYWRDNYTDISKHIANEDLEYASGIWTRTDYNIMMKILEENKEENKKEKNLAKLFDNINPNKTDFNSSNINRFINKIKDIRVGIICPNGLEI